MSWREEPRENGRRERERERREGGYQGQSLQLQHYRLQISSCTSWLRRCIGVERHQCPIDTKVNSMTNKFALQRITGHTVVFHRSWSMTHGLRGPGTITIPRRCNDGVATVPRALSFHRSFGLRVYPFLHDSYASDSYLLALHLSTSSLYTAVHN